ncbi:MAG: hypothetical protein KBS62_00250 [Oscillospiraceae bacterium]|nr:hypothetical protein [Candidatus Ruminococcus equi]
MKLEDFKNMVETRLKAESGNATEKSFLLEAYRVAEELKQMKQADDKEKINQEEAKTNKTDYNAVEQKRVATIFDYERMCMSFEGCDTCPLSDYNNGEKVKCDVFILNNSDKANEIILKYLAEHPAKTYRQDFLEKFPNAPTHNDGYPVVCAYNIYNDSNFTCENSCVECWDKECKEDA